MSETQKILLPKLKISYSLRNSTELSPNKSSSAGSLYVSPSSLYPSQKTIAQSKQPLRSKTKSQTNNSIQVKLKYNSRSPYYFKKQERTDQLIKFLQNQQKMIVDKFPRPIIVPTQKQNIIYQTQDKLKKGFQKRKKETKFDFCKKSLERTLTETNYSNFCPSKIPIVKSLHKVHPSSHVLYNS